MKSLSGKNILFLNQFQLNGKAKNVGVDPVISRHAGQEIKTGITYPLGLAYMASYAESLGHQVELLDPLAKDYSSGEILTHVEIADVIVTPYDPNNFDDVLKVGRDFKNKLIILVGEISHYTYTNILKFDEIDLIIFGEPEITLGEVLSKWHVSKNIDGTIYREKESGRIIVNPRRTPIEDLDLLPFPMRKKDDQKYYWDISFWGQPTAQILPQRGCPFRCVFCITEESDRKILRRRSASNLVDEIESIITNQGIRNFEFFDDTFNTSNKFVNEVCKEIIARELKIKWICGARPDLLERSTVELMKKAGCIELQLGLESTSQGILDILKKDMKVEKAKEGISLLDEIGINYSIHLILGSPGETNETIRKTQKYISSINPLFISYNILTPLPGSSLFNEEVLKNGLPTGDQLKSFDILHSGCTFSNISNEDLKKIIRKNYLKYYLSPRFCWIVFKEFLKNPLMLPYLSRTIFRQGIFFIHSIIFQLGRP